MKTLFLVVLLAANSITVANVLYTETFDDYLGSGIQPGGGSGTINSDLWRFSGLSDGDTRFADVSQHGDIARGQSSAGVRGGGLYSFDIAGNSAMGWQATGTDLTPGGIFLQLPNSSQTTWNNLWFSFELWYFNDQSRSTQVDFVTHNHSNSQRRSTRFSTPQTAEPMPNWQFKQFNIDLEDFFIPTGEFGVFEWQLSDAGGHGARDELAIDNLQLTQINPVLSVDEGAGTLVFCGIGLILFLTTRSAKTARNKLTTLNTADICG